MKLRFVLVPAAVAVLAFSLTGCGGKNVDPTSTDPQVTDSGTASTDPTGSTQGSNDPTSTDGTDGPGNVSSSPDSTNSSTTPGSNTTTPGSKTTTPGSKTTTPGSKTTTPGSTSTKPASTPPVANNWPATWPDAVPKMPGTIDYSKDNGIKNDPGIVVVVFVSDQKIVESYVGALQGAGLSKISELGQGGAYFAKFKGKGYIVEVYYDGVGDQAASISVTTKNAK